MRTVRDHSESKRVDLYPQTRTCPGCHQPLKEKYHKQRWIVQLSGQLQVVSHCLGCYNPQCSQKEAVYRPELEIFIGQLKKRRRQVTGRKNTQAFILREGSAVAILFGLPLETDWLESFAQVNLDDFHQALAALRRGEQRSKCWRIRRDLPTYLCGLEQRWLNSA